jgi:site-specific DNA recombinase
MTEPFDTGDATGRFLLTILAGVADLERETIRERTYAGLRRTVANGKWPGFPPLAYIKDKNGILEPNHEPIEGINMTPVVKIQNMGRRQNRWLLNRLRIQHYHQYRLYW